MDFVVSFKGSTYDLRNIPPSESVGWLKQRLVDDTSIAVEHQRLILKGKTLDNGISLGSLDSSKRPIRIMLVGSRSDEITAAVEAPPPEAAGRVRDDLPGGA
eukprot:CAMPEP_0194582434 /NCGR_PEP_ID=MMETSP0292-20121207/15610_1 /TAXON_ID=39354 /ORGANISM="Heterosigma akashiwo, Strain CCMP2393" /LENGTH=101 /DNA_ID=CAMNT_0039436601 /DNA_START=117 /DNA_END=419 /DNA_ORIENTATION=+